MTHMSTETLEGLITMKSLVIGGWSLPMAMDWSMARLRVLGFSCVSESVGKSEFVVQGHLAPTISPATTEFRSKLAQFTLAPSL